MNYNSAKCTSSLSLENKPQYYDKRPGVTNVPCSLYLNSNTTPRLSGHFSVFGLVFFVLSLLKVAGQWSREKCAILTNKPRSHVRILIYRLWAII